MDVLRFAEKAIQDMIKSRPMNPKTTKAGFSMAEIEDFGGEQRAFDEIFDLLFAIHKKWDANVIITAHVIEIKRSTRPGSSCQK